MAQVENLPPTADATTGRLPLIALPRIYYWLLGIGLVAIVTLASLLIWGPGMEYPTTVSKSEVATSNGNTIPIERSLRQVTGDRVDASVKCLTLEAVGFSTG